MAQVTTDRAAVRRHRNCLQPHALECTHISQHHRAIAHHRTGIIEIERVSVLHQEFAPAHHTEARPHLVAEFPLDVIQDLRQLAIGMHRLAEQIGDHLLIGRPVQHVAFVPIADTQHLLAVVVVAPALAPKLRRLNRRHQHFLRTRRVLLLAHDALDIPQHPVAERQPRVDASRGLPHQTGAKHQPVRGDLRFGRRLLHGRYEATGQAHRGLGPSDCGAATVTGGSRYRQSGHRCICRKFLCAAQPDSRNKISVNDRFCVLNDVTLRS